MNRIILSDGTVLTGFTVNGSELHFETAVDPSVFKGKMSPLKIESEEYNACFNHGQLITWENEPNRIAFCEQSIVDVINDKLTSKIDYVAMMTDVDLPTA